MRKRLIIIVCCLCLLTVPITLLIVGLFLPAQFLNTYYGELSIMYARLKNTDGKKIVVVGNSSVAFGMDSALLEEQLQKNGYEYAVCNFGLYGALGTKLMLDLSRNYIHEGDIVLFAPEFNEQSFSLYFSAEETWRALDSDFSIFFDLAEENKQAMVGSFTYYVAEKFGYYTAGMPAPPSGVYAASSFDERCDMKKTERAYNVMSGGADVNNLIDFTPQLLDENFLSYVNEYYRLVQSKGAEMYFSFAPVNKSGLQTGVTEQMIDEFYDALSDGLQFPILGNPHAHVLDYEWFYDSNVHLNDAGMTRHTAIIAEELLNEFGCGAPLDIQLPDKPEILESETIVEGDNSFVDCFTYREEEGMYVITGLTAKGATKQSIILPISYQGKTIRAFEAQTFQNNTRITQITLQENIKMFYDESFSGCVNLRKLILTHTAPDKIAVGYKLLNGTTACEIYVKQSVISKYINDYTWGYYGEYLKGY